MLRLYVDSQANKTSAEKTTTEISIKSDYPKEIQSDQSNQMENQIYDLQRQLNTLRQTQQELQGLQRNYAATQINYQALQKNEEFASISKGASRNNRKPLTQAKFSSTYQLLWQL